MAVNVLIFYIYPRHLSIKFPPLKLSTQQGATHIKITGTEMKKKCTKVTRKLKTRSINSGFLFK